MRPGQHNNKRNRNRNRRHGGSGGSGGGGGGGNSANRVYDSNGPDVKLRGTAQTIAEKYMQLGRDAQSSGDNVMAESYYQFGDHYYRLWLAAQPAGQPIQFSRRMSEEEMEDEAADGDDEGSENPVAEGSDVQTQGDDGQPVALVEGQPADGQPQRQNKPRDFQPRDNGRDGNNSRDGGRNFRQRWPRRNDRFQTQDGNGEAGESAGESQELRPERQERAERAPVSEAVSDDNWEAPSFLKRPAPTPTASDDVTEAAPVPRPRRSRSETPKPTPEEVPQGE